jgi:hypothetical protein
MLYINYTYLHWLCSEVGTSNEPEDDSFLVETCSSDISIHINGHFRNSVRSGKKQFFGVWEWRVIWLDERLLASQGHSATESEKTLGIEVLSVTCTVNFVNNT